MKKLTILRLIYLLVVVSFLALAACSAQLDADAKKAKQTQEQMAEADRQAGWPNIVNFQQKKMLKWIFELADRTDLVTYTYIKVEMTGQLIFVGKSLGFGVPFAAQYTNPERVVEMDKQVGWDVSGIGPLGTLPQPDPNGLYMPTSSNSTWVIMIHPKTHEPKAMYWEPEIVVSPFPMADFMGPDLVKLPRGCDTEDDWGSEKHLKASGRLK